MIENDPVKYDMNNLKGKNLGCWCNLGEKCHVDILINILSEME